jgi:hypothetical protein
LPHIQEFLTLWNRLEGVHTHDNIVDSIMWNLTSNKEYSSAFAYDAQFFGAMLTNFQQDGLEKLGDSKGQVLFVAGHLK